MTDLADLNAADQTAVAAMLHGVVERAPWVLDGIAAGRPFADADAVADAVEAAIRALDHPQRLRLLDGHPELAGAEAFSGAMTPESAGEQGRLGLTALEPPERARLARLNAAYRARFGYPYVVALHRRSDLAAVFIDLETRLDHAPEIEIEIALGEVVSVMRTRVRTLLSPQAVSQTTPKRAAASAP